MRKEPINRQRISLIVFVVGILLLCPCPSWAQDDDSDQSTETFRLLIDTSHDCFWTPLEVQAQFSEFIALFEGLDYEVTVGDHFNNLKAFDVAVLMLSGSEYSETDVALVREFLDAGGTMLVMGEWNAWFPDNKYLNTLLAGLDSGVTIVEASTEDPTNNFEGNEFQLVINDFSDHCLVEGLGQVLFTGAAPLKLDNGDSALLFSSSESFLLEDPETKGPFAMAAIADPVKHPNWNLIIFGETSHLDDYGLWQMDNIYLALVDCATRDAGDSEDDSDDDDYDGLAPLEDDDPGEISGGCGC